MITAAECAAAAEFAARDAVDFAVEWAVLSEAEREAAFSGEDEVDEDGHVLVPPEPAVADTDADTDTSTNPEAAVTDTDESGDAAVASGLGARWWEAEWLALAADGAAGATPMELLQAATADPGSLGTLDRPGLPGSTLDQLKCLDRLTAILAGHRHGLIAALCPVDVGGAGSYRCEQHLVEEIQVATRVGSVTAARAIEHARLLAGPFRTSREDLLDGVISDAHVRVLAWETRNLSDDPTPTACPDTANGSTTGNSDGPAAAVVVGGSPGWRSREDKLTAVQDRVAAYARVQTPTRFAATVRAAIGAVDPQGEADRHATGKLNRDVWASHTGDGMGSLTSCDDAATIDAIHAVLTTAARALQAERGGTAAARAGDLNARIGACRADVLAALVLGPRDPRTPAASSSADSGTVDGSHEGSGSDGADVAAPVTTGLPGLVGPGAGGSWEPKARDLEGHLVIDLATLRREADNPCLLDGTVIPAPVGRHLASSVKAWRRMVTDPVTGHLLDYGDRVYLPKPLVAFTKARDGVCAAPYCERPARRCQMDHRRPFPNGPSAAWNCGSFCDRHHPLKTEGWIDVIDSDATGAITYRTKWGQTITTEPHRFLPDPRPPTCEEELGDDHGGLGKDPPPF